MSDIIFSSTCRISQRQWQPADGSMKVLPDRWIICDAFDTWIEGGTLYGKFSVPHALLIAGIRREFDSPVDEHVGRLGTKFREIIWCRYCLESPLNADTSRMASQWIRFNCGTSPSRQGPDLAKDSFNFTGDVVFGPQNWLKSTNMWLTVNTKLCWKDGMPQYMQAFTGCYPQKLVAPSNGKMLLSASPWEKIATRGKFVLIFLLVGVSNVRQQLCTFTSVIFLRRHHSPFQCRHRLIWLRHSLLAWVFSDSQWERFTFSFLQARRMQNSRVRSYYRQCSTSD